MSAMDASRSSQRLSRSTGKMVVYVCPCPHPPPVNKTMMKRYGKLERQLRENWASLHEADATLKETRSSASTEVDSMKALKAAQEKEVQDASELEEAQTAQVHDWLARTLHDHSVSSASGSAKAAVSKDGSFETEMQASTPGGAWMMQSRDNHKDPCSPICLKSQGEKRWKSLFGDLGVAYATPGTGWMAYAGPSQSNQTRSNSIFSQSSSYLGLKCSDVFDLAIRAKNMGPVSPITLPDELKRRLTRMQSMGPLKP